MSWLGRARTLAWRWRIAVVAAAGVVAGRAGLSIRMVGPRPGLHAAALGCGARVSWAGAVAVVAIVVGGARRSRRRLGLGLLALAIALAAFGIPWRMQAQARRVPPIHDVTTDPEDPPAFVAVIARRSGARNPVEYAGPAVAAQQRPRLSRPRAPRSGRAPRARLPGGRGGRAGSRLGDRGGGAGGGTARGDGHDALVRLQGRHRRARPRARRPGSRVDVRSLSRIGVGRSRRRTPRASGRFSTASARAAFPRLTPRAPVV